MSVRVFYRFALMILSMAYIMVLLACSENKEPSPAPIIMDVTAPAKVSNFNVDSVNLGTAWMSWTASGDDGSVGTSTVYDLRYAKNSVNLVNDWNNANVATGLPAPRISGSNESYTMTGLPSDIVYYFAIKARDDAANISMISDIDSAYWESLDGISPGKISNFQIDSIYQGTVWISWIATGDDAYVGTATTYYLRYSTDSMTLINNWNNAINVSGLPIPQISGSVETFSITGLPADTTFYFGLKATDEMGNTSPISDIESVQWSAIARLRLPELITADCDVVSVPMTAHNLTGVAGLEVHIRYESQQMTYDSVTSDYVSNMITNADDSLVHFIWADINNLVTIPDGQPMVTIYFSDLIGISLLSFDAETQLVDYSGNPMTVEFTHGSAECSGK
ncbi:MAG: hypothetical protein ABIE07_06240 [Candidatus Zixiibacteriota bacterium]